MCLHGKGRRETYDQETGVGDRLLHNMMHPLMTPGRVILVLLYLLCYVQGHNK